MKLVAGIDIGKTRWTSKSKWNCLVRTYFRTKIPVDNYLDQIVATVRQLQDELDTPHTLIGCGIGALTLPVELELLKCSNLYWKGSVHLNEASRKS